MDFIPQITSDARQTMTLVLEDGSSVLMSIYFVPMQYGWFITNLQYQNFTLNGLRITNSPNMLHQWKNLLPFGLACFSQSDREPSQQADFSSGASKLYILTSQEVQDYEDFLGNG